MRVVTAEQMRAIDAAAVADQGETEMMQRAGASIASIIDRYASNGAIVGIAGNGNNGGDAFAALAQLDATFERVCYHDPAVDGSEARIDARRRAVEAGVELRDLPVDARMLADAGLLLDGLYGVNARLPLDDVTATYVRAMNESGAPILALDIATGCDPTTGALGSPHINATATIALGNPKLGSLLDPGRSATGDLWCATLGMRDDDADGVGADRYVMTPKEFAALLPRRGDDAEKRSAGAPLIIAGSEQFPGAAVLCAMGASRAGAGYVTVVAPAAAAAALRAHLIEQVVVTYDLNDPQGAIETISDLAGHCSSIAIGPGLGLSDAMGTIVNGVIDRATLPIVADAGALFHLAKKLDTMPRLPLVLTPHAGEFARLSGKGTIAPGERLERLNDFLQQYGRTTLLKGRTTLIADRFGTYLNPTGTSALATAGTGDVLTGIIATLLAQGLPAIDAARVGAYWHGRAGRVAQQHRVRGVIARDVAEALAEASIIRPHEGEPFRIF